MFVRSAKQAVHRAIRKFGYQITVEDPYFEKPWTYSYSFRRMPDYKLQEYVCEDNREYVDENGNQKLRIDE